MHNFFTTLEEYILTDVIKSAWQNLKNRMPTLNSFEELIDLHREYLDFMMDRCFL